MTAPALDPRRLDLAAALSAPFTMPT